MGSNIETHLSPSKQRAEESKDQILAPPKERNDCLQVISNRVQLNSCRRQAAKAMSKCHSRQSEVMKQSQHIAMITERIPPQGI